MPLLRAVSTLIGATLTVALTSTWSAAAAAVPNYRLVDLGTLGGASSYATAMNDEGAVVGRAQARDGTYHGFLWRRGTMTDLGSLSPVDVNDAGQVVGTRDDRPGVYLWTDGTVVRLGGGFTFPTAINNHGQVVGLRAVEGAPDAPARWTRGNVRGLPLTSVSDINDAGQVSGGLVVGDGFHATVWWRGASIDLGAAAFDRSNSYRINDDGWVIGWTFSDRQDERATLWRHATGIDLGTLGGEMTRAIAINDHGAILAASQTADGTLRPALWRRGALTDLTAVAVAADADLVDINNRGEIAGSIRPAEEVAHAAIYRPVRD